MRHVILLVLLSIGTLLNAQKAKLKDLNVRANYQYLPNIGLGSDVTAYSVSVAVDDASMLPNLNYSISQIEEAIKIPGYTKMAEAVAATVVVSINVPSGSPVKLNTVAKKRKDGTKYNEYNYSVTFTGSAMVKVSDPAGSVLAEYPISLENKESTSNYGSTVSLKKGFNAASFYQKHRTSLLSSIISEANNKVANDFGLRKTYKKVSLKRLSNKKHPAYQAWEAMEEPVKEAFKSLKPTDNTAFAAATAPLKAFYSEQLDKFNENDKEGKKMVYACRLNLAMLHLYSSERDDALRYAQAIAAGDEKSKKGKRIVEEIETINKNLDRLALEKRFFAIQLDPALQAKEEAALQERQALIESGDVRYFTDFNEQTGYGGGDNIKRCSWVTREGNQFDGYLVYDVSHRGYPDFRQPAKLRLAYTKDGKTAVGTPRYRDLQSIVVDSMIFNVMDVTIGSGLMKLKLDNALVYTYESFTRTSVLLIFPPFLYGKAYGQSSELEAEVAILDKENEVIHSTKAIRGTNHAMRKIVGDCPAALTYLEEARAEKKSKGLLTQILSMEDESTILESVRLYDTCLE